MTAVVRSEPDAIEAIQAMQRIISGGVTDQIQQLIDQGNRLHPGNWAGRHADGFYGSWPTVRQGLQNAITQLTELTNDIMTVNTNIQEAGGN
jgi:uncharacterized protein YukE